MLENITSLVHERMDRNLLLLGDLLLSLFSILSLLFSFVGGMIEWTATPEERKKQG